MSRKDLHLNAALAIDFLERIKKFENMKDTQVPLKRTSLLSAVKHPIHLTATLRAKRKRTKAKISI